MVIGIIIWFSLLALSNAFVLDSSSTPSAPTAHNFEQLLDLLLDEKHFRTQLEQQVQELRDELTTEKLAFEQQRNVTFVKLDEFQRAFDKEKSNRFHLEQAYTRLTMDFHNLSLEHDALKRNNTDLEANLRNVSVKYAGLDEKVKNLTVASKDNKQLLSVVANDINVMNQTSIASLNAVHTDIANNHAGIATNRIDIGTNKADIATNLADIATSQADVAELKRKQGYKTGFTASVPKDGPTSGTITFTDIKSNIGNHFNPTTGKYTCPYAGLYLFTFSIYQKDNNHETECWIRKNSSNVIRAAASSGTGHDNGYFQASNSVFLHLNKGDLIDIGHCYKLANTMDVLTTFTGFLVKND